MTTRIADDPHSHHTACACIRCRLPALHHGVADDIFQDDDGIALQKERDDAVSSPHNDPPPTAGPLAADPTRGGVTAPAATLEIPPDVLKPELWCRRTERSVCIRWCSIHNDYWLFGKPRSESLLCWHGIRRATARDVAAFVAAIKHNVQWVYIDTWENQRGGEIDQLNAVGRFQSATDRACAATLALCDVWDAFRDLLPHKVQHDAKVRFDSCRVGMRCYVPIPEGQR